MVGVNRHLWLLSRNKIQLQNSIALPAKLSINMAFVHPTLSSDIAFNISHSRYKNLNKGQTISPWEHLLNIIKNKSQRAHGTS